MTHTVHVHVGQDQWLAPPGTGLPTAEAWLKDASAGHFVVAAKKGDLEHPFSLVIATGDATKPVVALQMSLVGPCNCMPNFVRC